MVRLRTFQVRSAKGLFRGLVQRGLNIEALNNLTLGSIFFNLCEGKFDWRSSIKYAFLFFAPIWALNYSHLSMYNFFVFNL